MNQISMMAWRPLRLIMINKIFMLLICSSAQSAVSQSLASKNTIESDNKHMIHQIFPLQPWEVYSNITSIGLVSYLSERHAYAGEILTQGTSKFNGKIFTKASTSKSHDINSKTLRPHESDYESHSKYHYDIKKHVSYPGCQLAYKPHKHKKSVSDKGLPKTNYV